MLMNNLFTVKEHVIQGSTINAEIQLNPEHAIFSGHFPGQPVVPGVCMIQLIKEILQKSFSQSLQLKEASSIKFSSVINPVEQPLISITLNWQEGDFQKIVTSEISHHETTYFKGKMIFQKM
jgi:3-hydroxyacyl-[acyl-carrier-protein] dehydratase